MSKYKDRTGVPIKVGDVVARAITINHETFKGFSFAINIVKKQGRSLILDGVHGYAYLSETDAKEMMVLNTGDPDINLRGLHCEFSREFGPRP